MNKRIDRNLRSVVVLAEAYEREAEGPMRNILLVEPDYKTKFPPLGLMKLSSYHKNLGDKVTFIKGIRHEAAYEFWDRIYVTTLFTYHWKVTVETIKYYKYLVRGDLSRIFVGGILASLLSDDLWRETGIPPVKGVLNRPGLLGDDNYIVDEMVPDYHLFNNSANKYSLLDSYFGYSTRGCVHRCPFCGVHILEPRFLEYKSIKPYVKEIDRLYGPKQHLVFLDNNILASKRFAQMIRDVLDLGFEKGAKYNNRLRFVDFNQGVDARLLNRTHLSLLSQIAVNPLRIAFDSIRDKDRYVEKVRLAAQYGVRDLSNYILYNFRDTPEDFWQRLKINIDLNKELGLSIYSFPMRFIPLNAKDRGFIFEPEWNWQFLRNVQRILNVTKGIVMAGEDFFNRAFGASEKEFRMILHMPEPILMNRGRTPKKEEEDWIRKFNKLTDAQKKELLNILCENRTRNKLSAAVSRVKSSKLRNLLDYYLPHRGCSGTRSFFDFDETREF